MTDGITEMMERADLCGVSIGLIGSCSAIDKVRKCQPISDKEKESLRYAGQFWGAVDWDQDEQIRETGFSEPLATTLRPIFYEAIFEEKIVSLADIRARRRVYDFLTSGDASNITIGELEGSCKLLRYVHESVLSSLQLGSGEI